MITPQDIIVMKVTDTQDISMIANHTVNTWQPDRTKEEICRNTEQGKLAEIAVQDYLGSNYVPYDSFRTDSFQYHAPFDGVLSKGFDPTLITDNVDQYGRLDLVLRDFLRRQYILTVEIKSTRVSEKILQAARGDRAALFNSILQNHFLTYPKHLRYSRTDMDFQQYLNKTGLTREHLLAEEEQHASDIYVHVYMLDRIAMLIGWIWGKSFFQKPDIRRFFLKGKSEYALYYAVPLRDGIPMPLLKEVLP